MHLRCEYLANPLGIDTRQPRLSWRPKANQAAYRVLVASSAENLSRNEGDLWDSGEVASDQCIHVPYAGTPLRSRQRCYWKVQTCSEWSDAAWWEM